MRLLIKNIGPLKDIELELGDITILLGPPNSGKSYTLKSLYTSLIMLDDVARGYILHGTINTLDVWDHILRFIRATVPNILTIIAALHAYLTPENKEPFLSFLKKEFKITDIDLYSDEEELVITMKYTRTISQNDVISLLEEKLAFIAMELLPIKEDTKIKIQDMPTPKLTQLIYKALEETFQEKGGVREGTWLELFYTLDSKLNGSKVKITLELEAHLNLKSSILKNMQSLAREINIDLDQQIEESIYFVLKRFRRTRSFRSHYLYTFELTYSLKRILLKFKERLINRIDAQLKNAYRDLFNIEAVLFIPFGRSPLVYQLDIISNDPFLRDTSNKIYEDNLLFYSYIRHLSVGRKRLLRNTYGRVIKLFAPVLQGELFFDEITKKLRYHKWGIPDVEISKASALAGEVTGILLPILSIPSNSYVIIEEPEAQLHYSAQILMGLVLMGLAKEFNHKIIFSTHSDILALTIAYLKEHEYDESAIMHLIGELLKVQEITVENDNIRHLATAVSRIKDINLQFYYYKPRPDGTTTVIKEDPKNILKEVPGITIITDILASWALSS